MPILNKAGVKMKQLRAAVVGFGTMGRHHARILSALPDVDLVAVVDSEVADLGIGINATLLRGVDELPSIDVAVVATPTQTHVQIAHALLRRGVHILIEKPLAPSADEGDALVEAARSVGAVLAVGHVERHSAALGLLARAATQPLMLSFERLSPFTPRIRDSVVMDLMVHDLDLAMWIMGEYPVCVHAVGTVVSSGTVDAASALLSFSDGQIATLQASRVTQDKVRRICISERDRFLIADSVRQDVMIKRETTVEFPQSGEMVGYRQASVVEIPYLDRSGEPLARQLRDFLDAVREGRSPLVTGEDGVAAVRLAKQIEALAMGASPSSALSTE